MQAFTQIICPNCGSPTAERHTIVDRQLVRTECRDCDYLLITCQRTDRVIEAHAPGIDFGKSRQIIRQRSSEVGASSRSV